MKLAQRLTLSTTVVVAIVVTAVLAVVAQQHSVLSFWSLAGIGAVAIAASAVIAHLFARPVARPIEDLRDAARAIATGNLTRRPSLPSVGEVRDLSDALRRLAEQAESKSEALHAEEALLLALTESLNEGVIAVNARQQVMRINETARQLLRLKEAVPFSTDLLPRDRTLREALDAALQGENSLGGEARVDERMLSVTGRPLVGGGAALALYDVTPFRKLEAVRRDFVANVSHELRTPLTVISGFIETLQDENSPPELRQQFLAMASGNARRMQRIVDDLLDLSRIESGGWLPDPIDVDLHTVATEIIAPLQKTATEKNIQLLVALGDGAREAYVDATAIRQVLTNLAENALRHTTAGSVELFSEQQDDGVWIGVRDTGSGIGAEHISRIFERFYRADPSRSREAGGTGLGLAIVKHLAESHGGRIRAQSTLGTGTTIAAWFPAST